jgi:AbrB family looped-hinge helix DNA binding protein
MHSFTQGVDHLDEKPAIGQLDGEPGNPAADNADRQRWIRLSLWHGNGDVAKFEAAGVVALDVKGSGLPFVGIERTAGDPVNFFVVDGQRAVTHNRYVGCLGVGGHCSSSMMALCSMALQIGSTQCKMPFMTTHLTIDKAGRVVIPKAVREELHLEPGDSLEMESAGESITLRPVRGSGPLMKEHGVWVFRTGQPLPASATDRLLQQLREERDVTHLGSDE